MSDLEQARVLLRAAERDLRSLNGMSDVFVFANEIFGFHAHQAVEKSLKAWICLLGATYPFTHDLTALTRSIASLGEDTADFRDVAILNPFAVALRYDEEDDSEDPIDRTAVLTLANFAYNYVNALFSTLSSVEDDQD